MAYALLLPLVLFGDPAGKRAQETGAAEGNLDHMTDLYDDQGLSSLFASRPHKHLKKQHEAFRLICASSLWICVTSRTEWERFSMPQWPQLGSSKDAGLALQDERG